MKRTFMLGLVVAVLLGALIPSSATAAKGKKKLNKATRSVEMRYEQPSGVFVAGNGAAAPAVAIPSLGTEKFITLSVTDDSGQKVGGSIAQNIDSGTTADDNQAQFCGNLENAPISGGYEVFVYITVGTCGGEAAPSLPTAGTVSAQLTNM